MRPMFAGPTSNTPWKPTQDPGKLAAASKTSTDGYRVAGDVAGPNSSHKVYTPTEDSGKYVGADQSYSDGYRVAGDVAGPNSSHNAYTPTEDSGKFEGARGSDGYRTIEDQ